jgi:hypothetical protein
MAVIIIVNRRRDCAHERLGNYWDPICHCASGRPGCLGAVRLQEPPLNIWTVPHQGKSISPTHQYSLKCSNSVIHDIQNGVKFSFGRDSSKFNYDLFM